MKKGQADIIFGELIVFIEHVLPLLILLSFVFLLFSIFTSDTESTYNADFRRVLAEAEDLNSQPFDSVTVPLLTAETLDFYMFPQDSAPSKQYCNGKACLYFYYPKENVKEYKEYDDLVLSEVQHVIKKPVDKKITIKKVNNAIKFA